MLRSYSGVFRSCFGAMFQHCCSRATFVSLQRKHHYNKRLLKINRINIFIFFMRNHWRLFSLKFNGGDLHHLQPNLSEILSSSVQRSTVDDRGPGGGSGVVVGVQMCVGMVHTTAPSFKQRGKCDVCSHMVETSTFYSPYFKRQFAIHGQLPRGTS